MSVENNIYVDGCTRLQHGFSGVTILCYIDKNEYVRPTPNIIKMFFFKQTNHIQCSRIPYAKQK